MDLWAEPDQPRAVVQPGARWRRNPTDPRRRELEFHLHAGRAVRPGTALSSLPVPQALPVRLEVDGEPISRRPSQGVAANAPEYTENPLRVRAPGACPYPMPPPPILRQSAEALCWQMPPSGGQTRDGSGGGSAGPRRRVR